MIVTRHRLAGVHNRIRSRLGAPCGPMLVAVALLAGCRAAPGPKGDAPSGPLPSYAAIAEVYNARVAGLDRVWARSVVRVWYPDREGEEATDQVEGFFQYLRPNGLNLSFKKLGETYAALGSNDDRYWWIELREERVAWVGEHARATPDRARELSLPVQPLDLIRLLGVLPLPEPGSGPTPAVTRPRPGGPVQVTVFPMPGTDRSLMKGARYSLDPRTFEPVRIELLDAGGRVAMDAALSRYTPVTVAGGRPGGSMATQIQASLDRGERRMKLWLNDAENSGRRPREQAFDLDAVLDSLQVMDVRSIDEVAAAGP